MEIAPGVSFAPFSPALFLCQLSIQSCDVPFPIEMPVSRACGEYLTPPIYAAAAHGYLLRTIGEGSDGPSPYDTHTWWDPFAGSGRLLEPFPNTMAGSLFASTLVQEDLTALRVLSLTEQAHVFPFDFLNRPFEELPAQLLTRLRPGSRWVFILNPPFVGHRARRGARGQAVLDTATRTTMLPLKLGRASLNLTTQGLFRLLELVREHDLDATVGVFSQASVWTGEGYADFRKLWETEFGFGAGFLFDAREFEGVTGAWPATFATWHRGRAARPLVFDVLERGEVIGRKELCQPDLPLGSWVPRPRNEVRFPQFSSALTVATGKRTRRDKLAINALGYVSWLSDDMRNSKGTAIYSAPAAQAGWSVTPDNFEASMVAAAARMLAKPTVWNDCDQFSAPDTAHPKYEQFVADAVVWLIGSMGNHTASLGGVEYGGQTVDIPNHFFWMSRAEVLKINDLPEGVRAACEDALERGLSLWLRGVSFSPDADWVLAELKRLVAVTAAARPLASPDLQLLRWDAGWYQIRKGLLWPNETYTPPPNILRRYRSFKRRHKRLGERLAGQLYELGFLPRPLLPHAQALVP